MSSFTVHHTLVFPTWDHTRRFNLDDIVGVGGIAHIVTKIDRGENIVYLTKGSTYLEETRRGGLRVVDD